MRSITLYLPRRAGQQSNLSAVLTHISRVQAVPCSAPAIIKVAGQCAVAAGRATLVCTATGQVNNGAVSTVQQFREGRRASLTGYRPRRAGQRSNLSYVHRNSGGDHAASLLT